MKTIKICYSIRDNLGDAINPLIFEKILGYKIEYADVYHCDMSGIGSGLYRYFYDSGSCTFFNKVKKNLASVVFNKPVALWSAGFINTPTDNMVQRRKNTIPLCVRGALSKSFIEQYLGKQLPDCVLGDGGLLASGLIRTSRNKKYKIGIIPHDNERQERKYRELCENNSGYKIIDVRGNPLERIYEIAECECILSSALHGLIIADALHIPNRQAVLTNKLAGDGFKFRDYYSSFGLQPNPLLIKNLKEIDVDDIIQNYPICYDEVEQKKEQLLRVAKDYIGGCLI